MQIKDPKTMLAFIMLAFFVSACSAIIKNIPPIPTASPSPVPLSLPDFSTAHSITVIDNWGGLSPTAPMNSLYTLENPENFVDRENFQGSALFSVGGYWIDTKKETAPISAPKVIVQSFLQRLSQARPEEGQYEPSLPMTDDYPEITIRVFYGQAATIEFYTASQGDEHVPWKVIYNSKAYIVNSGIPMQALEILKPYLAQDVFNNLIDEQLKVAEQKPN